MTSGASGQTVVVQSLLVNKQALEHLTLVESSLALDDLAEGEVLLESLSFGFSANNITYAALGEGMGYWGFFPSEKTSMGIVPVWGFAKVLYSKHPQISEGEQVFGYLPMASHLRIQPGKITEYGFSDVYPQRKSISPVYDSYLYCSKDPGYHPKREAWQLNFRPLFMTSFVLDEFVAQTLEAAPIQKEELAPNTIILSSASSKTAFGTAFLLKANRAKRNDYKIIGLTSAANKDFTESLGCFDEVLSYDELSRISDRVWLLDFAANGTLIEALQTQLADNLCKVTLIGATDWKAKQKPNKKALDAEIFFAPHWVKALNEKWGQSQFLQRYAKAWSHVAQALESQMHEAHVDGAKAISQLYLDTLEGKANTQALNIAKF